MPGIEALNVVVAERPHGYDPIRSRRAKLVRAVDEQLAMIQAEGAGEVFRRRVTTRRRHLETDELIERSEHRRVARWWWPTDAGGIQFHIRYGSAALELSDQGSVVAVENVAEMEAALLVIRVSAAAGRLDEALAVAAGRLKGRFQVKKVKGAKSPH